MSREQQQKASRVRLRGEERQALMLRSAKRVFACSTYAEASTGELARESEVTEPMLYKHFGLSPCWNTYVARLRARL